MQDNLRISRRTMLKISAAATVVMAAPAIVPYRARAAGTRTVNVQLGWLVNSQHIGDVIARELGYQEEEGNVVEISSGGPNIDPVPLVASGQYDIGQQSSSPQIMLAASKGIPIQCFAVALQVHPFAYFSLKNAPIRTPQDMVGKRVGVQPAGGAVLLSALLRKNGIDESKVEVVTIGSDAKPLLSGQVDAIAGWRSNVGQRELLGDDAVELPLWDNGVRLLPLPYFATAEKLNSEHEAFEGYVRAAGRGWKYAFDNPEKAVEILIKAYPNLKYENEIKAVGLLRQFAVSELSASNGWGAFDPSIWSEQIVMFDDLKQFSSSAPKVEAVMTTAILDATQGKRARIV
ncbi:NitT/TauT family transport system substrate-binding protein [Aminobacter lissarensis]|uniref:Thiamine pyrimidine synthase n=1 Tax=Aminobacter carboxidus TaxID=376165 RepID=A0A8E2BFC2_9HYPH|nr:ABC transporter substrate-binding protein [Aminobacter lissarensis]MBB6470048.1 NitT/TauT family transport system substrate-binding protein [Aminobacter lissarensis]